MAAPHFEYTLAFQQAFRDHTATLCAPWTPAESPVLHDHAEKSQKRCCYPTNVRDQEASEPIGVHRIAKCRHRPGQEGAPTTNRPPLNGFWSKNGFQAGRTRSKRCQNWWIGVSSSDIEAIAGTTFKSRWGNEHPAGRPGWSGIANKDSATEVARIRALAFWSSLDGKF